MLLWSRWTKPPISVKDYITGEISAVAVGLFPVNLIHKYGEDNTASGSDNFTSYISTQTIINDSWSTNQLLSSWVNLYCREQHEHLWG